ncbi:CRISPR-associated endonuclease Cas2 [Dissulfurirhabdus thermomarina]|uniref:CRISPR-associated endoribonuclease Cas2 n=1 Tax=Dissulfurirhabdus thermomarina TaxID=1765737 RepID=A0A6N9TNP6_DISTH|nr:CRISPR-associated endonuclease Cas2 [Dissulfurirhabdus thermomarina]NDY42911.1 CRISPR-associated endonuclease Cas2 [Dissulfurirhabdus thermomarina]
MRRCYLVCYDIRDPKRLRRVHKVLKGYGESWQFSVFFCVLKDIDRVRLQTDLEERLNQKEDQVMILDLGPNEEDARKAATVIGQPLPKQHNGVIVV